MKAGQNREGTLPADGRRCTQMGKTAFTGANRGNRVCSPLPLFPLVQPISKFGAERLFCAAGKRAGGRAPILGSPVFGLAVGWQNPYACRHAARNEIGVCRRLLWQRPRPARPRVGMPACRARRERNEKSCGNDPDIGHWNVRTAVKRPGQRAEKDAALSSALHRWRDVLQMSHV